MEIIPAIDIINGKCVRLVQGNYDECTVYSENPLVIAKQFEEEGFKRLHLVDLDGAKSGKVININILKEICNNTSLKVDFSGGIKSDSELSRVFDAGAAFAGIGSLAYTDREQVEKWLITYGEKIIVGADVFNGKIAIHGWKTVTDITIDELIGWYIGYLQNLICTDISKDGMLQGASVELYRNLSEKYSGINIIASGGIGNIDDVKAVAQTGVSGLIIGKAISERKITLSELKPYLC